MRANERRIYHYDLVIGHMGKSSHVSTIEELFDAWQQKWREKTAFHRLKDGNVLYQINDIRMDNSQSKATILVSIIDRAMPDAAYANIDTRETTVLRKGLRDGGNLSAHLVIDMKPYKANTHLCLLEGVRRMTATSIYRLLNRILRDVHDADRQRFTYPDPMGAKTRDGKFKRHPYLPLVRLEGHPSPSLISDLENGSVRSIKLVKSAEKTSWPDAEFLYQKEYELTLGVRPNVERAGMWERITGAVKGHDEAYKTGRITFVDTNKNLQNVEFDVETGEPNTEDYIKYTMVRQIDPPLADASPKIVSHIEARMLALLSPGQGE